MKRYKVKHYKSRIYNPIRGKIIRAVLIIAAAAALFAVGWLLYEPIMNSINKANKEIIEQNPVDVPEKEKLPDPVPPEFMEKETFSVTVPTETLYRTEEYYHFLCDLDKDVTAVVFDMKTREGEVTYRSSQTSVRNAGATASSAVDLKQRIEVARALGFDVIARIYAFEDATAPYQSADMAIRYETEDGVLWLDDSVDAGGKPWLNPYSNTAQKYVLDIVYDAIDAGVDAVLLDGVRFPGESGLNYAYFGVDLTATKNEILKQFTDRVYAAAITTETDVIIAFDGMAILSGEEEIYGGSPTGFACDGLSPVLDFKALIGVKYPSFYFRNKPEDLSEAANAAYQALGIGEGAQLLPIFVCEGNEKQDIKALRAVFDENGGMGAILIYDETYFVGKPVVPAVPEEEPAVLPVLPQKPSVPAQSSSASNSSAPDLSSSSSSSLSSSVPDPSSSNSSPSSSGSYSGEVWDGESRIVFGGKD